MTENENAIAELNSQLGELGLDAVTLEASADTSPEPVEAPQEPTPEPKTSEESKVETPKVNTEEEPAQNLRENAYKQREGKRRNEIEDLKSTVSELSDLVKQVLTSKTPEKKEDAVDELTAYANANNLDATQLGVLTQIMEKNILSKIPKNEVEQPKVDPQVQEAHVFNTEWDQFSDSILQEFPNATAAQLKAAKAQMDKLAHSKEFHEHPLDYVYFKNKDAFKDVLFSPRRKSGENGKLGTAAEKEVETFNPDMNISSAKSAQLANEQLAALLGDESQFVMRNGEQVSM